MNSKKIELKDLRAIPPYTIFAEGENWIVLKYPNHHWTGFRCSHPELKHLLRDTFINQQYAIPKNEIENYIICDSEVLERYKEGGELN